MRLVLLLLLVGTLHAQFNGNLPFVYQSTNEAALQCGGTPNFCWANNVRSGDVFACGANWDKQTNTTTQSISDSAALITWTNQPSILGETESGGNTQQVTQMFTGVATGSGSTNISFSPSFPRQNNFTCVEIAPPNGDTLAFDAHNECTGIITTCSLTTSVGNDVVVCLLATPIDNGSGGSNADLYSPAASSVAPQFGVTTNNVPYNMAESFGIAGAAGSKTCSWNLNSGGGNGYYSLLAVAFKPAALTIGTSVMPAAGTGTAYSATFVSNSPFAAAQTWSTTATSAACSGITMSSAGVFSGANPTTAGTCTLTAKVTDGTHTATVTLGFQVASSLQAIQAPICTTYSTNPGGHTISGVKTGDALFAFASEIDTHGRNGQLSPASDMTDTCGDLYTIATPVDGGIQGGAVVYTSTATCPGTIGLSQTLPGGANPTPLAGIFCDIPGSQPIVDTLQIANSQPTSTSATLNTSFTTPVPNEEIIGIGMLDSSGTVSLQSPCVVVTTSTSAFAVVSLCDESAATTGAYALSSNYSDAGSFATTTPLLVEVGLRPAPPFSSSVFNGEKKRRHPE